VIPPWNGQFGKYLRKLKEAAEKDVLSSQSVQSEAASTDAIQ